MPKRVTIVYFAALLTAYAAVLAWLTWPLAAHLATHLPNPRPASLFDPLLTAWAGAHETRALAAAPSTLLDAGIFHPARRALLYCEAGFGILPVFSPSFLATGNPTLALNLTLLVSLALTAAVLHAVVARWVDSELGGALAAWAFLQTRWTLWHFAPTAPNYAVLQYLPLIMLLAATPAASLASALRLVPLLVLQSLSSILYLALAAFAPLVVLSVARLARRATRAAGARLLAALAAAALILLPLLLATAEVRASNPSLERQTLWGAPWPRVAQPVTQLPWGPFRDPLSPSALPGAAFALIGVGALGLCLRGRKAPRLAEAWRHGLLWAVAGFSLSLTPVVVWNDRPLRLPQADLASWIPAITALRVPGRLGVAALMGLALLVGVAFAECARHITNRSRRPASGRALCLVLALVVAALMYADNARGRRDRWAVREPLPAAYPIAPAVGLAEPLLAALRAGEGPVLELPLWGRRPGHENPIGRSSVPPRGINPIAHARAMYRAIAHRRPILNGYCGYWPEGFEERMQLAALLPDPDRLATLHARTGLTAILLHRAFLAPEDEDAWRPVIEGRRADLPLVVRDGDDYLFAVRIGGG